MIDTDMLALEIAREVENIISDTPAGRAAIPAVRNYRRPTPKEHHTS